MNKIYLFFICMLIIIFTSCNVYDPYIISNHTIDFSSYSKEGFFITESNSVSFEYEPIGSIITEVYSGYNAEEIKIKEENEIYGEITKTIKKGVYVKASPDDAIYFLIEQAKELGANGIINLKIQPVSSKNEYKIIGYYVTGMAIKKK